MQRYRIVVSGNRFGDYGITTTIHGTPKRSVTMPKLDEKNVFPSGTQIFPPSESALKARVACSSVFTESDNAVPEKLVGALHWPSVAITTDSPMRRLECMIFSPGGVIPGQGS